MYFVYILHSQKDGKLYSGFTKDLKSRLLKHKSGKVISTKIRRPFKLIHYETFLLISDALRREKYLKGGNGKKEIEVMLKSYFEIYKWKK